jgi:glutamate-1-semialdehyde 2,1-aminomutase
MTGDLSVTTAQLSVDEPGLADSAARRQYVARTPLSARHYQRTLAVLAGGTSRQTAHWFPYPLTMTHGRGCRIWDADGNEYIDLINNYTSLIHGHAYEPVIQVIADRASKGLAWSANNLDQVELAGEIARRVSSVDALRFTNSGSEAAALALQIVRAITGRTKILMARSGYHGVIHEFQLGSLNRTGPYTLIAKFNDEASFREQLDLHGADIAAVFLEPMLGAGGVLCATSGFLRAVIEATHSAGALFVLDEVQSFRMATGGLQQLLDVEPDLTMFGKFIGGGLALGAVGGRRDIMRAFDPDNLRVYHSGTFNGNPTAAAAGYVTVRDLTPEKISGMETLALRLRAGLRTAAARLSIPLTVNHLGSLLNVFFMSSAPETAWTRTDQAIMQRFHLAALNRGVFFAHRGFMVLSTAMTDADVDEAIGRLEHAMADLVAEL